MGGGFAGAGAGAQAFGQGYSGLMGEQARIDKLAEVINRSR